MGKTVEQYAADFNDILFKLDPMHTGCVENDLYDEYSRIAWGIAEQFKEGIPLTEAIANEFDFWFWEEGPLSESRLSISNALQAAGR
jgi:hypothetical protein